VILGTGLAISTIPYLFPQDSNTGSHNLNITFPEIALLDIEIEGGNDLNIILDGSVLEPGEEVGFHEEGGKIWINYTSLVGDKSSNRKISVRANNIPEIYGLTIGVVSGKYKGNGKGKYGIPTSMVIPCDVEMDILTGIGSAYTSNGVNNGHQLSYYVDYIGKYEDLKAQNGAKTVTFTYTISD